MTPVENLKKKLRKRPSYVEDDRKWEFRTEQILGWIVFLLILVSFMMAGFITYAAFRGPAVHNFNNGKYESIKYAKEKELEEEEAIKLQQEQHFPALERNFLLEEEVTIDEIFERKRGLEDDYYIAEREVILKDYIYEDVPRDQMLHSKGFEDVDNLNKDSKAVLEEAEKLLDEEAKLIKELTLKLENIGSFSEMVIPEEQPEPLDEFTKEDDGLNKIQSGITDQQPNKIAMKNKKTKVKNPLVPKKNVSKVKAKDMKKPKNLFQHMTNSPVSLTQSPMKI